MLMLEKWLKYQSEIDSENKTVDGMSYFEAYNVQKQKLMSHVYPSVEIGLLKFKPPNIHAEFEVYSNHGLPHVEALIRVLGRFIGCRTPQSAIDLNPFEVFLLLMAAISHDAGNIFGRENHQRQIIPLLNRPELKVLSMLEMSEVANIAQAHTGKGMVYGYHEKDTLIALPETKTLSFDKDFRPRKLAALIRFCDEICEDANRIPRIILNHPLVTAGPSSRYLYYGNSIDNVNIDYDNGKIEIMYKVYEEFIMKKMKSKNYKGEIDNYFIIDEIISRIIKIKSEMDYCFPYIPESNKYKSIIAEIKSFIKDEFQTEIFTPRATINLLHHSYQTSRLDFGIDLNQYSGTNIRRQVIAAKSTGGKR